jgi:hypothetical protein
MFLKKFFLFLLLFANFDIYCEPYEKFVDEVLKSEQTIKLSDGSCWKAKNHFDEFDETENWQSGDQIVLEPLLYLFEDELFFKNLRSGSSLPVEMVDKEQLSEEKIYRIESFSPQNGYLLLNDQSVWSISWWENWASAYRWNVNDRIIIFRAFDLDGYYLINLDQTSEANMIYATFSFNKDQETYCQMISHIFIVENTVNVQLDNGFIWTVQRSFLHSYSEEINSWRPNDKVCFYYSIVGHNENKHLQFYLANLRTLDLLPVNYYQLINELSSYKIEKIETFGSFFSLNYYVLLTLNDGSHWKITKRINWKEGDRILISRNINSSYQKNGYILINPDKEWKYPYPPDDYFWSTARAYQINYDAIR